jgi:hypothetical protein
MQTNRSLRKPTGDTVPLSQLLQVIEERSFHGISSRHRICKQRALLIPGLDLAQTLTGDTVPLKVLSNGN